MTEEQKQIVNDALDYPEPLTDWESDFIDSLAVQDYEGWVLSEAQAETLLKIGEKY